MEKEYIKIGTSLWRCDEKENGITVNSYEVTQLPKNWKQLKSDLFHSALFEKAIQQANSNAYSTLLTVIADETDEQALLQLINMLGLSFSIEEKTTLNKILTDNNFTIQIL